MQAICFVFLLLVLVPLQPETQIKPNICVSRTMRVSRAGSALYRCCHCLAELIGRA